MHPIKFTTVKNENDIAAILALQAANHTSAIDQDTKNSQGFVTVRHDEAALSSMNRMYPSVIALSDQQLAGYCLMMPRECEAQVPILAPLFDKLSVLEWKGKPLSAQSWFVMGQVCVAAEFRGQGVFDGMYHHLREVYAPQFDRVITEVSEYNTRSMRTHERVGFELLKRYQNQQTGEWWRVIVWEWT
jgi:GNAT superfamily N-acetyltransferase